MREGDLIEKNRNLYFNWIVFNSCFIGIRM